MCGIAGFLSRGETREAMVRTAGVMASTLSSRGPDDRGHWVDEAAGVGLGHTRLSIVDLSPEGHQPMVSACGRYVIVYNGEVYGFGGLRDELEGRGERFRGHSDTEVLLAAVSRYGLADALPRLNGMFAFALWDRAEGCLFLVRDRMGIKPLYYGWAGTTFLFGSELRAMRAHPRFDGTIERTAVAELMRWGYIPAPLSIHRGTRKLPPGFVLTARPDEPGKTESFAYWSTRERVEAALARPFDGDERDAEGELDRLLGDAVAGRMVADVPLGALLSGGIDSSLVVALMQAQSSRPVKTFTIGFGEAEFDEAAHARAVAGALGTDHTCLTVTPEEALSVIPDLPRIYDEPFGDASGIPTVLVSKLARSQVTVGLSGDGGDEVFCGYDRYRVANGVWRKVGHLPAGLRRAAAAVFRQVPAGMIGAALRGSGSLTKSLGAARFVNDRVYRVVASLAAPSREQFYTGMVSHWDARLLMRCPEDVEPPLPAFEAASVSDYIPWMMLHDLRHYLPDDILTKVDRASMAFGLEVRVPLLDYRVVEFGSRLPLSFKLEGGRGKKILRRVLDRYVDPTLVDRPKQGFGVPVSSWLRGPLRNWAEALLDGRRLDREGYFRTEVVRKVWSEHLSGTRNWPYALWDVLVFQAWLETHGSGQVG